MKKLYFPSHNKDDENSLNYTQLFLTGAQRFKALFDFAKKVDDPMHQTYLIIPEVLHCHATHVIAVHDTLDQDFFFKISYIFLPSRGNIHKACENAI